MGEFCSGLWWQRLRVVSAATSVRFPKSTAADRQKRRSALQLYVDRRLPVEVTKRDRMPRGFCLQTLAHPTKLLKGLAESPTHPSFRPLTVTEFVAQTLALRGSAACGGSDCELFRLPRPYGLRNLLPQTGKSAGLRYNLTLTGVCKWKLLGQWIAFLI